MALINFSREDFIEQVARGTKHHTIRKMRKTPIHVGEELYLYTGLRTPHARKLKETVCIGTHVLELFESGKAGKPLQAKMDGKEISSRELKKIYTEVGFASMEDFAGYFREHYEFPFKGQLVEWE